jgi:hypothetical protein
MKNWSMASSITTYSIEQAIHNIYVKPRLSLLALFDELRE